MSAFNNPQLIIKNNELPIVNGRRIKSIYACMETAYRTDQILHDCYTDKPDFYHLVTEDRDYINGKWFDVPNLKVKTLPSAIAALFGKVEVNGKQKLVRYINFRTSDSGSGAFIDDSVYFSSFSYYRMKRGTWGENSVFKGEPFEEKINAVLGKKFQVEVLPEWYDKEYPHSPLRREGNLWYPDFKLTGWRRSYKMPFVSNNYPNQDHIRVFYEPYNAHIFLSRVKEINTGDENLVAVSFSRDNEEWDKFCCISTWADTKKEDPNGIIRFKALNHNKDWGWEFAAMLNDKIQFKRMMNTYMYQIDRIVKV